MLRICISPADPNRRILQNFWVKKDGRVLRAVREDYDIIIADTPPVLPVTDAAVLCQYADGVVLVAGHGMATYDAILYTKANLKG